MPSGKAALDPNFAVIAAEFLNLGLRPWPGRAAQEFAKQTLQPFLDERSFSYSSKDHLLQTRDLLLRLWDEALRRLNDGGSTASIDARRTLHAMIDAIMHREEFHVEFLGYHAHSERTKRPPPPSQNATPSTLSTSTARKFVASLQSASSGSRSVSSRRPSTSPAALTKRSSSTSFSSTAAKSNSITNTKLSNPSLTTAPRVAGRDSAAASPPHAPHDARGGSSGGGGLPVPPIDTDGYPGGHFEPKRTEHLDHGRRYCKLLSRTVVLVNEAIETSESTAVTTKIRRRMSRSSLTSRSVGVSNLGSSFNKGGVYFHGELQFYANVLALAYFRVPEVVALVVRCMRRAIEALSPRLLSLRVAPTVNSNDSSGAGGADGSAAGDKSATGAGENIGREVEKAAALGDVALAEATPPVCGDQGSRWAPVCQAFCVMQSSSLQAPGAWQRRRDFVGSNPTLYQWRRFYSELSEDLVHGLELEHWLLKLTCDGYFFSMFVSSLIEHLVETGTYFCLAVTFPPSPLLFVRAQSPLTRFPVWTFPLSRSLRSRQHCVGQRSGVSPHGETVHVPLAASLPGSPANVCQEHLAAPSSCRGVTCSQADSASQISVSHRRATGSQLDYQGLERSAPQPGAAQRMDACLHLQHERPAGTVRGDVAEPHGPVGAGGYRHRDGLHRARVSMHGFVVRMHEF